MSLELEVGDVVQVKENYSDKPGFAVIGACVTWIEDGQYTLTIENGCEVRYTANELKQCLTNLEVGDYS